MTSKKSSPILRTPDTKVTHFDFLQFHLSSYYPVHFVSYFVYGHESCTPTNYVYMYMPHVHSILFMAMIHSHTHTHTHTHKHTLLLVSIVTVVLPVGRLLLKEGSADNPALIQLSLSAKDTNILNVIINITDLMFQSRVSPYPNVMFPANTTSAVSSVNNTETEISLAVDSTHVHYTAKLRYLF